MAIKINNVTVVTDNEELDCSNSSIKFPTYSNATLPSSDNVDGDTVFNTDTDELVVFWNGSWISAGGKFRATGGDRVEEYGGRTYHIFTSPGNFVVKQGKFTTYLNYTIVGGGGGGGRQAGGGGGGAQMMSSSFPDQYLGTANSNTCAVTVGAGGFGAGRGPGGPAEGRGENGAATTLDFGPTVGQFTVAGGGGGGAMDLPPGTSQTAVAGRPGACGGGGGAGWRQAMPGGTGSPGQPGGTGRYVFDSYFSAGGGGSPQQVGGPAPGTVGGNGGYGQGQGGLTPTVGTPGPSPSQRYFCGGGAGCGWNSPTPRPAYGGGGSSTGAGNVYPAPNMAPQWPGTNALPNTGAGGGGRSWNTPGYDSNGADGIVIIHYVTP